jgi:hypothetical protein
MGNNCSRNIADKALNTARGLRRYCGAESQKAHHYEAAPKPVDHKSLHAVVPRQFRFEYRQDEALLWELGIRILSRLARTCQMKMLVLHKYEMGAYLLT